MERMQGKTARAAAQSMSRRSFVAGLAGLGALSILGGCSGSESGSAGSSGAASESGGSGAGAPGKVVVGTLATEDLLPLWAAQADGLFDQGGLEVEIVVFQSAPDKLDPFRPAAIREDVVFRQEAVARMDGVAAGGDGHTLRKRERRLSQDNLP